MRGDLVLRAQAGDQQAFAELVGDSIERLYRIARLIVHDDEAARDGVQEALISAWVGLPGLRDPGRFDAWIHRLLVRECLRVAGQARRQTALSLMVRPAAHVALSDSSGVVELRDQLEGAFRQLPIDARAVLVLHYYADLGDAAGAAAMGIPVGTYRSRLSRAKQSLRAALAADGRAFESPRESSHDSA
jgi:RNA polymerase sigma-70 factor (ECF subfamily)